MHAPSQIRSQVVSLLLPCACIGLLTINITANRPVMHASHAIMRMVVAPRERHPAVHIRRGAFMLVAASAPAQPLACTSTPTAVLNATAFCSPPCPALIHSPQGSCGCCRYPLCSLCVLHAVPIKWRVRCSPSNCAACVVLAPCLLPPTRSRSAALLPDACTGCQMRKLAHLLCTLDPLSPQAISCSLSWPRSHGRSCRLGGRSC
jgi:hypothetical protein